VIRATRANYRAFDPGKRIPTTMIASKEVFRNAVGTRFACAAQHRTAV